VARSSIAIRLALGLSIGTAVLWLGAATISGLVMHAELGSAFDETLKQGALRLLPLAIHDLREPGEAVEHEVDGLGEQQEQFTWFVRDRAGNIVVRAGDATRFAVANEIPEGFSTLDDRRRFLKTDLRTGFNIAVMETTDHRDTAFRQSVAALIWPLAALIPLIAGIIWFAIRLAMRPVERLRQEIAARGSRNLTPLSTNDHPTELAPIAEAVADLLIRLEAALNAERVFAASSAHELRTPIAGALAQTQQLAIELGDAPGSERLKEIEISLKNLSKLSEQLLQLSRLDAGFARTGEANELIGVVQLVVRDFQSSTKFVNRVHLHIAANAHLLASIEVDAFAISLRNLIQNALIHGPENGSVDVFVSSDKTVQIVNGGPVIPNDLLQSLGQPFVRGNTLADGTGLGLSIARMIIEQADGTLKIFSPASGQESGFEVVLTLP
jgi:two-component system OmpR family sensor kinase